jgi:hypothetical protein
MQQNEPLEITLRWGNLLKSAFEWLNCQKGRIKDGYDTIFMQFEDKLFTDDPVIYASSEDMALVISLVKHFAEVELELGDYTILKDAQEFCETYYDDSLEFYDFFIPNKSNII